MPRTFFEDGLSMRRADCELFSRIRLKWRPIVVPEFRVDPESTPPEKRIEFLREEDAHVVLDDALRLGADLVVPLDSIHLRGAIIFIAFRDDYFSAPVRIVISGDRMALLWMSREDSEERIEEFDDEPPPFFQVPADAGEARPDTLQAVEVAAAAFCRARASMGSEASSPVIRYPRFAMGMATLPVPHPSSRTGSPHLDTWSR
ncbi:hypothetical protein AMJ82_08170 [candidate division TA06 bacterium SM23_40]|uniref:Uncharacterized protein n=1 Tax=candidate division TA06 bacterium SM23_40 TaxID=1703774 RepID=A0A0S8G9Y6_UNCT6|nr:MAG: hypothetical protein AMJ82_08170 [candidate division TA06 bacterium SM23_40]